MVLKISQKPAHLEASGDPNGRHLVRQGTVMPACFCCLQGPYSIPSFRKQSWWGTYRYTPQIATVLTRLANDSLDQSGRLAQQRILGLTRSFPHPTRFSACRLAKRNRAYCTTSTYCSNYGPDTRHTSQFERGPTRHTAQICVEESTTHCSKWSWVTTTHCSSSHVTTSTYCSNTTSKPTTWCSKQEIPARHSSQKI